MNRLSQWRRSLAPGLAAVALCTAAVQAQTPSLAERIALCATCHGDDGNSRLENIPSLAGQPEFFLFNQLFLMREGVRQVEAMMPFVKDLKDNELQALARHYSALEPKASGEAIDPALVQRGQQLSATMRCGSCHLPSLAGQEQMPRVAKQRVDYLIYSMKAFRDNTRSGADTMMSNVVAASSDADLVALAHYAASL